MTASNTATRWGAVAQILHWLVAVLVSIQFVLAKIAADLPLGVEKIATLARHKSIGITILALAAVRLLWRWRNVTPALPPTLPTYERNLAHVSHVILYVLLFAMPLSGWMMSSARNFSVSWFALVQLPDLVPADQSLYLVLRALHEGLAWALGIVVTVHVLAALKHHFVLKDDVLRRMLPRP